MPEMCERCPMRDDPGTTCAAIVTGHKPYCASADPRMPEAVWRLSYELAGEPVPAERPAGFPPLVTQARNLAGAVVAAVKSGGKKASPEEQARRLAICAGCDQFVGGKCRQCGCVAKWKARLAAWHCPLNPPRW